MVVDNHYPDIRVEREAKALLDRGYVVDVICLRREGEPKRERMGDLSVHRLPGKRRRGASPLLQLWEYVTFTAMATAMVAVRHVRSPYDTVQVHNVPDFLVFSALVPKLGGAGVILDLHDLMPEFFASRIGGRMDSLLVRAVKVQERMAAAFSDQVITVTELWRQTLIERGIPADKIIVVMNLPDESIFGEGPAPATRQDGDPLTVIYHGTITHRYGLDLLLHAFARARQRQPLRLIIHGRGEYLDEVRQLVDQLGLAEDVRLSTQSLPTDALPELIRSADIGVVPYRSDVFTDGILPTKLMEYATLGVPSIASRTKAVTTYFTDDMVRLVEPGSVEALADALSELAADPERRSALAHNALRFAQEHRWESQAVAYADAVERVTRRRTRNDGHNGGSQ
jgi:glycosyltransferase involved in cell wall biosynthesis